MNLDSLIEILNNQLIASQDRCLSSTEILLLKGIWKNQTYNQIAQENGYSAGYLSNVVAPEMCRRLSQLIGKRVTKKNCRAMLEFYVSSLEKQIVETHNEQTAQRTALEIALDESPGYPSGPIPLHSPFYIERCDIEEQIRQQIQKPGALVRIKAPQEMGKSSLLLRVLNHAEALGYRTTNLNLQQADREQLGNFKNFLRWFCSNIARDLGLALKLDDYWDPDLGSAVSCTLYLQKHILGQLDAPLVVALDEVNRIFEYREVAQDFLPLLRSWYEEAKKLPIWKNLRIIVAHSTEIYVPLNLKQSPFNVGLPVLLERFNIEQVQELAQRYHLDWHDGKEAEQLMALVGGHPSLVQIALYYLSQQQYTLDRVLATAASSTGIYAHHLRRHAVALQEDPDLARAFQTLIDSRESVQLEPIASYKLYSMGLIQLEGDRAMPSCELYRQYFWPHSH